MNICFNLITKIIFTYSSILRKKKYCRDYEILIDKQCSDVLSKPSENLDNISKSDSHKYQICEEPLDLSINEPELKRPKLDLKDIEIANESNKEDNLIKVIVENDIVTNEFIDTQAIEDKINGKQLIEKGKDYLSSAHINNLHSIIEQYVTRTMKKTYPKYYLLRFSKLFQTYKILANDKNKLKCSQYIFRAYNTKIINILQSICSQFKSVDFFSEIDCDDFNIKLSNMMRFDKDLRPLLNHLDSMHFTSRIFIFYAEFMKCSKYFSDIPELMTLGGIYSDNSPCDLLLSIHLINLLLDTTKNIAEIKVFITFLIRQSFANSFKSRLHFSSVDILPIKCSNNHDLLHNNNLNVFLWEIHKNRRGPLLFKLNGKQTLSLSEVDKIHFKTVLIMFVFQQIILLKLNNVVLDEADKYIEMIHNIITEDNCPVCDLNKFLKLLKIQ